MGDSENRNRPQRKRTLAKDSIWMYAAAGLALMIFLALLNMSDHVEIIQSRKDPGYSGIREISCREVRDDSAPAGVKKEYEFSLSDTLENDTYLAFYTVHQYVRVYLEGEQIYCLQPQNSISKTVGSNWVMIPLYREDEGKHMQVEIIPAYESFRNREVQFLTGSQLAVYKACLYGDLPQIILGIVAVFAGLVFIFLAVYIAIKKKRRTEVIWLGMEAFLLGVWRLTDTKFISFLFPEKSIFLFYLSISMLMLLVIPLLKWIETYLSDACCRILDGYCIVTAALGLMELGLQFCGIFDLREVLLVIHLEIACGIGTALGCIVYEKIHKIYRPTVFSEKSFLMICAAGILADGAAFYIKGNSSGLIFSLLAFLIYIIYMCIVLLFDYNEQEAKLAEKDRELAEKERKLTERRISTMMSQIRTHFIFNILTTISGLCKYDPKKADEALILFSRYLRRNIRIIEEEGLIDLRTELAQVEDYIALEQIRFQDMITFEKDLEETGIRIPSLTIQPLVENAIKHGFLEHDRSGTVWLSTTRKNGMYVITVKDDGAGFPPEALEKKDSAGIKNVEYRLKNMADGKLEISSIPGQGTTVSILIPIEEAE